MSDETPGAGQGALPPREGQGPRTVAERPTMRLTHVGGQYVLTAQTHGVPALAQISSGSPLSATRIISISPSRVGQSSPLRPSVANQSIVNVLKARPQTSNIRLQLFSGDSANVQQHTAHSRTVKRPLPQPERKDTYAAKLQRVMNHRIVRSKLVKEKYSEHLLEAFYLDTGGNILDLYQYAKRPKSQAYLNYLKEHAIDPRDYAEESTFIPQTTPSTPTATSVSSLPGMSHSYSSSSSPTVPSSDTSVPQNKTASVKNKTPSNYAPASNQEQIVEKAKQEAYVVQRIADLQKEGLWSEKRLPKVQDMPRSKAHWDFLLEEMVWLAADFAQERKWKKSAAKKCARMVQKYFQDKALAAQRAEKAQEQHLRRIASYCAKEIKNFWNNVEKLVEYKQNTILEEKRKKALDQQLSFIVDQTEKYSQLLAEGMNKPANEIPSSTKSSRSASRMHSDDEFEPETQSDEDDEETIEQEEAAVESAEQTEEIAALQRESQMELDDLLEDDLLRNYLLNRDSIRLSESEDSDSDTEKTDKSKSFRSSTKSKDDEESKNMPEDDDSKSASEESDSSKEEEEEDDEEDESEDETELSDSEKKDEHDELKMLVEDNNEGETTKTDKNDDLINDAAAIAESIQPKGNTLSSTSVSTKVPFLLKFPLREYQHIGLDWLVTMFERKLNGILADEMGLGKTIQTIALLGHLACEKENWGPHLIVVPTSVMLNWEMECKKWCPAFKILTYYGTQKERKLKRTGWTKPNAFHICITSYKLVIQDHQSFRRKKWKYLILDEAQNIKNFKSQRWQLLLNFQTQQRLLLTGTPLQNNLMELWSLMHFLMPNVFQSHREFKEWFSNPVTGMIEGNSEYNESIIKRLHKVLRPFLLRRLKSEVEKQMPKKYEHVVMCRLSKRQRFLYDDYMSRAKTRETLASGNLLSVINVLMQLRKVCNHPNLFEVRPTISPFQCDSITFHIPSLIYAAIDYDVWKHVNLYSMNLLLILFELHLSAYQCYRMREMRTPKKVLELHNNQNPPRIPPGKMNMRVVKVSEENKDTELEKKEMLVGVPQGVKVKVSPQYGVQLVSQQGVVKAIPVVSISQSPSGSQAQTMQAANVSSVLKPSDKISASFAQLVQTSTGKHLLLTSNPNITGNIPVTTTTQGGQKLTLLSKQAVSTSGNTGHQITKAFVKFHITSVTTATTTTTVTTSSAQNSVSGKDEASKDEPKTVGAKFIEQLYANQYSLDVRWGSEEKSIPLPGEEDPKTERRRRFELMAHVNERRCMALPLYGKDFQDSIKIFAPCKSNPWVGGRIHCLNAMFNERLAEITNCLSNMLYKPERRIEQFKDTSDRFIFYVPAVKSSEPELQVWHPSPSRYWGLKEEKLLIQRIFSKPATPLHHLASAMVTQFPDPRLIQYDCGKLQTLDKLLRKLKHGGHRALIFTQMTKMLDVLEAFLNFHGHIYLRLDGTTKVDQRQVLMERFNGDKRIFAFILSTRSGGVGVNLTGADTVIFYDSDWNPTMDAQAQDRCHRIGQTRDVHIYRLVSERTIEENILKKANQKRLLGDLAIEGGNFTTAYFKSSTIQDLFNVDQNEESAASRMSEMVDSNKEREKRLASVESNAGDEKVAMGALENALAACEDDQDVQAARTAKAEAVADLAEFDENIPLDDQDKDKEPELSKAEQEIDNVIKKLSPIERYAMRFIEETESAWSAEQLAAAAREIEEQKREWEKNRLAAMKEEEERRARELEEEADMITFSREDATNQIWVSDNTMEKMPMWCPPTPPQQDTDIYIDQAMSFLYETNVMSETQLPPIYVKKESNKRTRLEAGLVDSRRALKMPRKEESTNAPKSLFHSATLMKLRRDMKLQKFRGIIRPPLSLPGKSNLMKPAVDQTPCHDWTIHEDMALLKVIQSFQGLPLNLFVMSPGHTPNWDFVADYVNTVSITYRSAKQCRQRYESVLMQREEGKQIFDNSMRKKKKTGGTLQKFAVQQKSGRPMRTSQLYTQDNNSTFSQVMIERFDTLKSITNKRMPTTRTVSASSNKNNKHTSVLNECGIDLDHPVLPVEVAARRAERIAKEKKAMTPEQRIQYMKGIIGSVAASTSAHPGASASSVAAASGGGAQVVVSQTPTIVTAVTTTVGAPGTSPNILRAPRIIASPMQTPTVVSVSLAGMSPAQLQAAGRLIVSAGTGGQAKAVVGTAGTVQGKQFTHQQLMIKAATKNQLRLHAASQAGVKTSTVTIGGQPAVVQFTQAQPRGTQFVRQTATVGKAGGIQRTVTDSEMAQLFQKKHQLQQQKLAAAQQAAAAAGTSSGSGQVAVSGTVQGLSSQVFAQTIQQAGTSGTPIATLVKSVSTAGGTQTVTIPVTGVTLAQPGKSITPTLKMANNQQLRHLQMQHIIQQKKLNAQKLSIAQVSGKNNVQTQLIVGSKPLPTTMQFIRSPMGVSQGPVVLAKGPPRVIPVNAGQGAKQQTIQVVTATSQGLNTALRPQGSSTLAGALTSIKVQPTNSNQTHQAILSQVSAALQNQGVRQGSPVRIQTAGGSPIVAVTVQQPGNLQQQQQQQGNTSATVVTTTADQG